MPIRGRRARTHVHAGDPERRVCAGRALVSSGLRHGSRPKYQTTAALLARAPRRVPRAALRRAARPTAGRAPAAARAGARCVAARAPASSRRRAARGPPTGLDGRRAPQEVSRRACRAQQLTRRPATRSAADVDLGGERRSVRVALQPQLHLPTQKRGPLIRSLRRVRPGTCPLLQVRRLPERVSWLRAAARGSRPLVRDGGAPRLLPSAAWLRVVQAAAREDRLARRRIGWGRARRVALGR